jgi:AcrR family transcriptional regulator
MSERREELIEKALDYFLEHGLAGLSLRPLAEHIGTSARLLVYHFGSKDGLVTAVMHEVQARAQASFAAAAARHKTGSANRPLHVFWTWVIHPSNIRSMRLLFEVQALALQNPAGYAHYLEGTSSTWLELIEGALPPSKRNRVVATLCAAVVDGLVLEYLNTGDRSRTTQALDLFTQLMQNRAGDA